MATSVLREVDVDKIVDLPKTITRSVIWTDKQHHGSFWACTLDVSVNQNDCPFPSIIRAYLNVNKEISEYFTYSMVLNNINIGRICVNGSHGNRHTDKRVFKFETHIHKWTDLCNITFAQALDDLLTENREEVFSYFCSRYNITFSGQWNDIPHSTGFLPGVI
jgi:hypothetical protein